MILSIISPGLFCYLSSTNYLVAWYYIETGMHMYVSDFCSKPAKIYASYQAHH
jgi:hypothetical protein